MSAYTHPPRVAARLIASSVSPTDREVVLEDMAELYALKRACWGTARAWAWYWRQSLWFLLRAGTGQSMERGFAKPRRRRSPNRRASIVTSVVQDLRYTFRGFVRSPGFTLVAVVTLALGIGANTAIFSVVNSVVMRPLPFPESERIVAVWVGNSVTPREMEKLLERTRSYAALAAVSSASFTLTGIGEPEEFRGTTVGTEHVGVFATAPALGTGFRPEHAHPGLPPVAILSHEFFERRFGGDPSVVGRAVPIGGEGAERRTVIGVMPPDYRPFAWRSEIYVPLVFEPGTHEYTDMSRYTVTGRLREGTTVDEARAELRGVLAQMREGEEGAYVGREAAQTADVASYLETQVGEVATTLWVLLGAVGAVLLIACTNVANLLLARAGAREREMAIRTAMGAGKARLIRQLVTENLILGVVGGAVGVVGAAVVLPFFVASLPLDVPRMGDVEVDSRVLTFAAAVSLLAGLLFGVGPALRSTGSLDGVLRDGSNAASPGRRRFRLNGGLVGMQIALCVVLVTGAGLLGKSLWRLGQVDPGFAPEGLYTLRVAPSASKYPTEDDRRLFYRELADRIAGISAVAAAGAIQVLPMTNGHMGVGISTDGEPVPDGEQAQITGYRMITPGYIAAMGIPVIEGRTLMGADRADAPPVGLVNRRLADLLWPDESAIGREVRWSDGSLWFTVVGVVGNVHQHTLAMAPRTEAYVPYEQDAWIPGMHLMVRASTGPAVLDEVRRAVWSVDPDVPVSGEGSMENVVGASMLSARFYTLLFASFACLALLLGAVGVYGVTSYTVSQRNREIGIRLALGAGRSDVMGTILRSAMVPVLGGLLVGIAGAAGLMRLLSNLLFDVAVSDPLVFGLSIAVLAVVAVAANVLPARRAAAVDPLISLSRG